MATNGNASQFTRYVNQFKYKDKKKQTGLTKSMIRTETDPDINKEITNLG